MLRPFSSFLTNRQRLLLATLTLSRLHNIAWKFQWNNTVDIDRVNTLLQSGDQETFWKLN